MRSLKYFILLLFLGTLFTGCFDDNDDVPQIASTLEINDFIHRGMRLWYLYKDNVPDLADNRFSSNQEYTGFLGSFSSPEAIFSALRTKEIDPASTKPVDDFSFLVDDYIALEQAFDGITRNNGMEFGLIQYPNGSSNIFGYVRYVLPDTDAEAKGIKRGDIFNTIDGVQMTIDNRRQLLSSDSYTIGLATYDGNNITPTGTSVALTKVQYTENPVFINKTLDVGGNKVGYLMYNAFTRDFDPQLNAAFAELKANQVTELILDLRYNGGGDTETAKDLADMITGQFNGDIFTTEEWNSILQELASINRFDGEISTGAAINSLNLTKVYMLTTRGSASASELVISGLTPYITVMKVGDTTRGKFQASVTVYDSDNFGRQGANPGHTYAIQPLVLKSINSAGLTDYFNGFAPDILLGENLVNDGGTTNLGVLGDENEPLLKAAIDNILGNPVAAAKSYTKPLKSVGDSKMFQPNYERMYKEIDFSVPKN